MKKNAGHKIVIIGCGNVAWHIAKHLRSLKKYSLFVYNHQANPNLKSFKSKLKCSTAASLDSIIPDAAFYFICVSDRHIGTVSKKIKCGPGAMVLHTSGSAGMSEIKSDAGKGVFYPLQTFSKSDVLRWKEIPVIIEASSSPAKKKLVALAGSFTKKTLVLNYHERLKLHLTAVLVNNFTNALYVAADKLLKEGNKKMDFSLLMPLIRQTTRKIERMVPLKAQTGPAKRNDTAVLRKHMELLATKHDIQELYNLMSKLILKQKADA